MLALVRAVKSGEVITEGCGMVTSESMCWIASVFTASE